VVYTDVEGAPVKIGQAVTVAQIVDIESFGYIPVGDFDEQHDAVMALVGEKGNVVYLDYKGGVGESFPKEPAIGVSLAGETHMFWFEELAL
jgi:hypothetical protein